MRNGFIDCNMRNNLKHLIAIESKGCCSVKEQLTHFDMNTHSELRLTGLPESDPIYTLSEGSVWTVAMFL